MSEEIWYFVLNGKPTGPVAAEDITAMIAAGELTLRTLVWRDGLGGWEKAALHFGPDAMPALPPVTDPNFRSPIVRNGTKTMGADGLYIGAPAQSFFGAVTACMKKFLTFSGRASRSEYWNFVLFCSLAAIVALVLDIAVLGFRLGQPEMGPFSKAFTFVTFVPMWAVSWRRMHDINRSGWWMVGIYPLLVACVAAVAISQALFGSQVAGGVTLLAAVVALMYVIRVFLFLTAQGDRAPNRFG